MHDICGHAPIPAIRARRDGIVDELDGVELVEGEPSFGEVMLDAFYKVPYAAHRTMPNGFRKFASFRAFASALVRIAPVAFSIV
jgi:hypothetical protein